MTRIGSDSNSSPVERASVSLADKRRQLAALAQKQRVVRPEIAAAPHDGQRFPLSDIQEAFLVGRQLGGRGDWVGCHAYLEFVLPNCEVERLQTAWNQLIARHEALRTIIHNEATQSVLARPQPVLIQVLDLRQSDEASEQAALAAVRQAMSHKVYAPEEWPLCEVRLSQLPNGQDVVHLSIDEWIADAASIALLLREWQALYEGRQAELEPPPPTTFREHVALAKELERGERFLRDRAYWQAYLVEMPAGPALPQIAACPAQGTCFQRTRLVHRLPAEETARLLQLAKREQVSLTSILLTLFGDFLAAASQEDRFALLLTLFDRAAGLPEVERVVGPFVSTLIFLRDDAAQSQNFLARVKATQAQLLSGLDRASISGVRALRELKSARKLPSQRPLQVVFTSMLNSVASGRSPWFENQRFGITQTPQVFLDHHVIVRNGGLETNWDVALELFGEQTVQRWFSAYGAAVAALSCATRLDRFVPPPWDGAPMAIESPLTTVQQSLILDRLRAARAPHDCVIYQEFKLQALELTLLTTAWQKIIARHDALRTVLLEHGAQQVLAAPPPYIPQRKRLPGDVQSLAAERHRHLCRRFPIGAWPPFELSVSELPDNEAVVHLSVDPAVADGPSIQTFAAELFAAYAEQELPPLSARVVLPEAALSAVFAETAARNSKVLGAAPRLEGLAPSSVSPPERLHFTLEGIQGLEQLALRLGTSLDALLCTAFLDVVQSWNQDAPFSIVYVDWSATQGTLLYRLPSDSAGEEFATRARARHAALQRERATAQGPSKARASRHAATSDAFSCVYTAMLPGYAPALPPGVVRSGGGSNTPGVALDCISMRDGSRLLVNWDVRLDARNGAARSIAERSFRRFEETLRELISRNRDASPGLPALAADASALPALHQWFEQTVQRFPERIAVSFETEQLTYRELNQRANQLARHLRALGVDRETLVALCIDRTPSLVVAILGVLKAGGAYVPLDVHYPTERVRAVVEDAQVKALITTGSVSSTLDLREVTTVRMDVDWQSISQLDPTDLNQPVAPAQAAYVIYTSGSTGKPKGVVVEHRNANRLFSSTQSWYNFDENDVWTLFHSYAFDFSVWEMWGALLYGGRLVVVPYATSRAFDSFHELLWREGVTVLNLTPTAFRHLLESDARSVHSAALGLRYIIFGGEKLAMHTLRPWFARHGARTQLVNMYGITETTVHVTYRPVGEADISRPSLIGVPIPDLELYLLDKNLEPVQPGCIGELYVAGAGVSRGYLRQPELTAERFFVPSKLLRRLYKTGDLGRYLPDGELEFIGRCDHQVQLRGFRVELGEVEAVVATTPGILTCAALVSQEDSDDPKLIAFVVPQGQDVPASTIRRVARERLPDYMVPNQIISVPALPLTPEGKLDRKQLLRLCGEDEAPAAAPALDADCQPAARDALCEKVLSTFQQALRRDDLEPKQDMLDAGATSLTLVRASRQLLEKHGIRVPVELLLDKPSVAAVVDYLLTQDPSPSPPRAQASFALPREPRLQSARSGAPPELHIAGKVGLVSRAALETLLSLLLPRQAAGVTRRLYASAGGKYAVECYLEIFRGGVEGLGSGLYFFDPEHAALRRVSNFGQLDVSRARTAAPASAQLHLVLDADRMTSTYGALSLPLCWLEAGYLLQLLLPRLAELALCAWPANAPQTRLAALPGARRPLLSLELGVRDAAARPHAGQANAGAADSAAGPGLRLDELKALSEPLSLPDSLSEPPAAASPLPPWPVAWQLATPCADEQAYLLRASQRHFEPGPVSLPALGGLLELVELALAEKGALCPALSTRRALALLLYVKEGAVAGLPQGMYRYEFGRHALLPLGTPALRELREAHAPFNRAHFDRAAFGIHLLINKEKAADELHLALVAAGQVGQLLQENQSLFGLGLVPIGGQNFGRIVKQLGLGDEELLAHGWLGGVCTYEQPLKVPLRLPWAERTDSSARPASSRDVAIIGLSGRFPGARELDAFFAQLECGAAEPRARWPQSRSAMLLDDFAEFDCQAFGLTPTEAKLLDPQERLVLQTVWECMEHSGYTAEHFRQRGQRVGVYVGAMWGDYEKWAFPKWQRDSRASLVSLQANLANRVSWQFDFKGPSLTVNTACSSALSALGLAQEALRSGTTDVALVIAVNVFGHPYHLDALSGRDLLAPKDRALPFGSEANGMVLGEGVGGVLLKRAEDAARDKDCVLAVLKAVALGHSGRTRLFGLPRAEAQAQLIRQCCQQGQVAPAQVTYVESAASGISVADLAEAEAIVASLSAGPKPCTIGTLKAQIGHLESASGMSQLVKVILQMQAGTIVRSELGAPLHPMLPFDKTRFQLAHATAPWPADECGRRYAIVNAVSASGASASALLEGCEPVAAAAKSDEPEPTLIVLSSATVEQLGETARRLARAIRHGMLRPAHLRDVGKTLLLGRRTMAKRAAFVVDTLSGLCDTLEAAANAEFRVPGIVVNFSAAQADAAASDWPRYREAAQAFVAGREFDWESLVSPLARRTPLPGYSARPTHLWFDEESAPAVAPAGEAPARQTQQERAVAWLSQLYIDVAKLADCQLEATRPLEEYGLSSYLISQLHARFMQLGLTVPATLFYECGTLREAASWLLEHRGQQLQALLPAGQPVQGTPRQAAPAAAEKPRAPIFRSASAESQPRLAIVGLSGRYPGARNIDVLWQNLRQGVDSVRAIPRERWDFRRGYSEDGAAPGPIRSKWGGFLEGVDEFDPLFFRISQAEAERIDPQERLFLQTAWQTLEDAGYSQQELRRTTGDRIGVFVGCMYNDYALLGQDAMARGNQLALGASAGSIANRVSYFLNLRGPSLAVDTMCSSSLMALHLASESILRGECEAALVGGVNLSLHPHKYRMQSQLNMLSPTGRCHSFGAQADGIVLAEAVGVVLLKPLSVALRDGDHVYGVLRATTTNHGGHSSSYTVPNPLAQAELISGALTKAGLSADAISYLEAHGTGTALGDPIELAGLRRAFGDSLPAGSCAIGSVKSNFGHAEAASGIASLTKVLLQLRHRELVPSLHAEPLNPRLEILDSPFRVQTKLAAWTVKPGEEGNVRRAGISSFGAGGVNVHALVEEFVDGAAPPDCVADEAQLFVFSAADANRLAEQVAQMRDFFAQLLADTQRLAAEPAPQMTTAPTALPALVEFIAELLAIATTELLPDTRLGELSFDTNQLEALRSFAQERYQVELSHRELSRETTPLQELAARLAHEPPAALETITAVAAIPVSERRALRDYAFTLQVGRNAMDVRLAFVAASLQEVVAKCDAFRRGELPAGSAARANGVGLNGLLQGPEAAQFLAALAAQAKLEHLGALWMQGVAVDFSALHAGRRPRRVSLPTYPFARVRCWVQDDGPPSALPESVQPAAPEPAQPFIGSLLEALRRQLCVILKHPESAIVTDRPLSDLGFDSVAALTLKPWLEQRCGGPIALSMLDPAQSLDELVRKLPAHSSSSESNEQLAQREPHHAALTPSATPAGPFALTDLQQSFVVGRELAAGGDRVGCHIYLELLFDELDVARLEKAWNRLVRNHSMLTTKISRRWQEPLTSIPHYVIKRERSSRAENASLEACVARVREELSHKVYAVEDWPLFELRVTELADGRAVLHVSMDELIVDASSIGILLRQLESLYKDEDVVLEAAGASFREHILAQSQLEKTDAAKADLEYWLNKLEHAPKGPSFATTGSGSSARRRRLAAHLSAADFEALRKLCRTSRASMNSLLLTVFCDALAPHAGSSDFSVLQTFWNRVPLGGDVSTTVGPFTTSSIFVYAAQPTQDFAARLAATQAQCWQDLDHQRVSGVRMLRELKRRGKLPRDYSLPVVFTCTVGSLKEAGSWFERRIYGITQTPQVYLDHQAYEEKGGLTVQWDYAENYLAEAAAEQLFAEYVAALRSLARPQPDAQLPVLVRADDEAGPFPLTTLQHTYAFARRVQRGTNRNCIIHQRFDIQHFELERLRAAWQRLIEHHEMLRVVINADGTQAPHQGSLDFLIEQTRQQTEGTLSFTRANREVADQLFQHVFELGQWPLFRLHVVTPAGGSAASLHLLLDGAIADGRSVELLYSQLFALYSNPQALLLAQDVTFRDYVHSLQRFGASEAGAAARAYHRERLSAIPQGPQLALPVAPDSRRGHIRLSARIRGFARIKERALALGVKSDIVALTAYLEALAAHATDPEFTVVVVNWDRLPLAQKIDQVVGDFCSLSLISRRAGAAALQDKMQHYQRILAADWQHSGVSVLSLIRERELKKQKVGPFPVVFTRPLGTQGRELPDGVTLGEARSRTPQVVLDHLSCERHDELEISWDLDPQRCNEAQLRRAFQGYVRLLNRLSKSDAAWTELDSSDAQTIPTRNAEHASL